MKTLISHLWAREAFTREMWKILWSEWNGKSELFWVQLNGAYRGGQLYKAFARKAVRPRKGETVRKVLGYPAFGKALSGTNYGNGRKINNPTLGLLKRKRWPHWERERLPVWGREGSHLLTAPGLKTVGGAKPSCRVQVLACAVEFTVL